MNLRIASASAAALAALTLAGVDALAATCQVDACTQQIQAAAGLVVNDIFHDANGNDGQHLPVYGAVVNNWPNCPEHVDYAGAGHSNPPYDCPGEYTAFGANPDVATANTFLGSVDRQWWQPCRLNNPTITNGCVADWTCIADGTGGNYNPWQGLVFDLGGPSNKVAIFAENDHGPQPCESLEYTVFLSDNPYAQATVLDPKTTGVDPMKWNRAVLSKIYTGGWIQVRPPDPTNATHAACGDTTDYSVEEDSFVQVFSLPCGITFRYAAVVAGNDGLDFPACAYDSNEGEIDAVAGLTENGAAVCPDADGDHYVDCNCPGHPPVCDCNDSDPNVHPGAPEACDATTDLNCDGMVGTVCAQNLVCYQSVCIPLCGGGENPYCPPGSSCKNTAQGNLCVPNDCGCAPGQVCVNNVCVDACANVVCPGTQVCQDGNCVDPCTTIQCPTGTECHGGQCVPPCNCFAGNLGCPDMTTVCDNGGTNLCVPTACQGKTCNPGETCDANGNCVSFCSSGVMCPQGQKCVDPTGCVPLCSDVTCQSGWTCDPTTGMCVDMTCANVTCFAPQVCMNGVCVTPDGGAQGGGGQGGGSGGSTSSKSSTGSNSGGAGGSGGNNPGSQGKCGCRVPGDDGGELPLGAAVALLGMAVMATRRRRR